MQSSSQSSAGALKLLYPGMRVKRWVLLLLAGLVLLSLGSAYALVDLYRAVPLPGAVWFLTLQFLPRLVRAALFGALGAGLCGLALRGGPIGAEDPDRGRMLEVGTDGVDVELTKEAPELPNVADHWSQYQCRGNLSSALPPRSSDC